MDFETLYAQHAKYVYRYILSLCRNEDTAEEILGETFYRAICAAEQFKGECSVRVWLCQIAKNSYFTMAKKSKRFAALPPELAGGEDFEEKLQNREQALEIHQALHRLPEPYKEVFSLRLFSELSFAEIASLFRKSESWARVTFYRAKNKIKEELLP